MRACAQRVIIIILGLYIWLTQTHSVHVQLFTYKRFLHNYSDPASYAWSTPIATGKRIDLHFRQFDIMKIFMC
jgi:hypothetical protein